MKASTTISGTGAGVQITTTNVVSVNSVIPISVSLNAAIAGVIGTYTSGTSVQLTLPTGHGISAAQRLDVYWKDATTGLTYCQYGCTVGTLVGATGVPVTGGAGNTFPNTVGLAITCQVPAATNISFTPANVQQIGLSSSQIGNCEIVAAGGAVCFNRTLRSSGGDAYQWTYSQGDSNPTSGTPAICYMSNGGTTASTMNLFIAGS